jgi:hypothetical protein
MEKKFEEEYVLPKLAENKRFLTELRDYHQPLTKSSFISHQKSYENIKRLKGIEHKAKREKSMRSKNL